MFHWFWFNRVLLGLRFLFIVFLLYRCGIEYELCDLSVVLFLFDLRELLVLVRSGTVSREVLLDRHKQDSGNTNKVTKSHNLTIMSTVYPTPQL